MTTECRLLTLPVFLLLGLDLRANLPLPMLTPRDGEQWWHIEFTKKEAHRTAALLKAYRDRHRERFPHIHGTAIVTLNRPGDPWWLRDAAETPTAGFVYDFWIDEARGEYGGTWVRWENAHAYRRALG